MADDRIPQAPRGLKTAGKRLWRTTLEAFELTEHELSLLREACRNVDLLDDLQAVIDREGVLDESPQGRRAHPAVVELRQQRLVFARLVAQLGIPVDDEDGPRGGRRGRGRS